MASINKDALVKDMTPIFAELAKEAGLDIRVTQKLTGLAVDAYTSAVKAHMALGNDVKIVNFGSYELRTRAGRTGRNPKTGEALEIAPSVNYGFSPSNNVEMPSHEVASAILAKREAEKAARKAKA